MTFEYHQANHDTLHVPLRRNHSKNHSQSHLLYCCYVFQPGLMKWRLNNVLIYFMSYQNAGFCFSCVI